PGLDRDRVGRVQNDAVGVHALANQPGHHRVQMTRAAGGQNDFPALAAEPLGGGQTDPRPGPDDQDSARHDSTSASSIRLPNGSQKKASFRLIASKTKGSVTMVTPRWRSPATVASTLVTLRQKWW